jgi:hypothetical protein
MLKKILLGVFLVPAGALGLYLAFVLNYSYSEGNRAGYLQKFSSKGWVCKTFEGELAMTTVPGVAPLLWSFSVREDNVAAKINAQLGKKVTLHYREHRGIPTTCFGETGYFVDQIEAVQD